MLQQLPPFFSYQASGKIWQVKVDLVANCLGIEVRNGIQEVSFSYVCPQQDKVIFEGLSIEGGVLTNLVACNAGVLLFQQFDDLENLSDITSLALDAGTQEVLWAVENYRHFMFAEQESIGKAGTESDTEAWTAIHLQEGNIRAVADEEIKQVLYAGKHNSRENNTLLLPVAYGEGEPYFKTVSDFLRLYKQVEPLKSCEYLHVFDKMVISFYTAHGEKMTNRLVVFDAEGNLLLHRTLADDLHQPGSETFMVWNQQLFFIENRSSLKGYNLQ